VITWEDLHRNPQHGSHWVTAPEGGRFRRRLIERASEHNSDASPFRCVVCSNLVDRIESAPQPSARFSPLSAPLSAPSVCLPNQVAACSASILVSLTPLSRIPLPTGVPCPPARVGHPPSLHFIASTRLRGPDRGLRAGVHPPARGVACVTLRVQDASKLRNYMDVTIVSDFMKPHDMDVEFEHDHPQVPT
jgi:hypothetical protein